NAIDLCDAAARSRMGASVLGPLLTPPSSESQTQGLSAAALFSVQHGLVELWRSWVVHPTAALGNGEGRYAAAVAAQALAWEDALRLALAHAPIPSEIAAEVAGRYDVVRAEGGDASIEIGLHCLEDEAAYQAVRCNAGAPPLRLSVGAVPGELSWWTAL